MSRIPFFERIPPPIVEDCVTLQRTDHFAAYETKDYDFAVIPTGRRFEVHKVIKIGFGCYPYIVGFDIWYRIDGVVEPALPAIASTTLGIRLRNPLGTGDRGVGTIYFVGRWL